MSRRHEALIRLFVPLAILCTLWTILAGRSGMFIAHDERLAVQPEMRNVYASTVRAAVRRKGFKLSLPPIISSCVRCCVLADPMAWSAMANPARGPLPAPANAYFVPIM